MNKENIIKTACQNANHVCDKTQYKEATLLEKVKLSLHLILCRACKKYSSNNQKLSKVIKDSKVECLNYKEKEDLEANLTNAIKEHQN